MPTNQTISQSIASLSEIDISPLGLSFPGFIDNFFTVPNKLQVELGQDFVTVNYDHGVNTEKLETLLQGFATELGLDFLSTVDIPNILIDQVSLNLKKGENTTDYKLTLSNLDTSDAIDVLADLANTTLPDSLKKTLSSLTKVDLTLSNDSLSVGFPGAITLDATDLSGVGGSFPLVSEISNQVMAEVFPNGIVISEATFGISQGDSGAQLSLGGLINGEALSLNFANDDMSLNYDVSNNDSFNPFKSTGLEALSSFDLDEISLSKKTGFGLEGSVNFKESTDEFSKFMANSLKVSELDFDVNLTPSGVDVNAGLDFNKLTLLEVDEFSMALKEVNFGLEIKGTPLLSLDGSLSLQGYDPFQDDEPELILTGGMKADTEGSLTALFKLEATGTTWTPFGIEGYEVKELGIELGFNPYSLIDNVGFVGTFAMPYGAYGGVLDVETALMVDVTDPNKLAMTLTLEESIGLMDLWTGPVAGMATKALSETVPGVKELLGFVDDLFEPLAIEVVSYDSDKDGDLDPLVHFVPLEGMTAVGKSLDAGLGLNGEISAGGLKGTISMNADPDFTAFEGGLSVSEFNFADIIKISGAEDSELNLDIDISTNQQLISGDGRLEILGTEVAKVDFEVSPGEVSIKDFDLNFFNVLALDVDDFSVNLKDSKASGQATLNIFDRQVAGFKLDASADNLTLEGMLDIGIVSTDLKINIGQSLSSSSVVATYNIFGETHTANLDLRYLDNLAGQIETELLNITRDIGQAAEVLVTEAEQAFEQAFEYIADFASPSVAVFEQDILSVYQDIGQGWETFVNWTSDAWDSITDFVQGWTTQGDDLRTFSDHNNFVDGKGGVDVLYGKGGNDKLLGGNGDDWLLGGDGNDYLDGGNGIDTLFGEDGDDLLKGSHGDDVLYGNDGNDRLEGGHGIDRLRGHEGNDRLEGGHGNDLLWGHEGNDYLLGGYGEDQLEGGDGNDLLDGGHGHDVDHLYGQGGDDYLIAHDHSDHFDGGSGRDTVDFSSSSFGLNIKRNADNFSGIEAIIGTHQNDRIEAVDANNNFINGQDGNDKLTGSSKNDTLLGGNGKDELFGQAGNDTLFGGNGKDKLYGGSGNDRLDGGHGHDVDYLYGEGGDDYLIAHNHSDHFYGGSGRDTVDFSSSSFGLNIKHNAKNFSGIERIIGTKRGDHIKAVDDNNNFIDGNDGNDRLVGSSRNDTLFGGNGNDILFGGTGNDYLSGGEGNDILIGTNRVNLGNGERDILIANKNNGHDQDTFILGEVGTVFYKEQASSDYALIRDFDIHNFSNDVADIIQLGGNQSNYSLSSITINGMASTAISYSSNTNSPADLIGIVEGINVSSFDLNNANHFKFV